MGITAAGRMINADISRSKKIAQLSPEALALFCLLIPHFNAHGKMLANKHLIKGLVCPYIEWLSIEDIELLLMEISDKTNVKYWQDETGEYLQSVNWQSHQKLETKKLGPDYFPSCPVPFPDYSATTRRPLGDHSLTKLRLREVEDKVFLATAIETDTLPDVENEKPAAADEKPMPVSEAQSLYRTYFNTIHVNQPIVTVLQDICRLYPPEQIREAFQAAPGAGANSLNWIRTRLENKRASPNREPDYDAIAERLRQKEAANAD